MPKFKFGLKNGKTLTLEGDTQPADADVEAAAKDAGVELALAEPFDVKKQNATMRANTAKQDAAAAPKSALSLIGEQFTPSKVLERGLEGAKGEAEGFVGTLAAAPALIYAAGSHPLDTIKAAGAATLAGGAKAYDVLTHLNPMNPAATPEIRDAITGIANSPKAIGALAGGIGAAEVIPPALKFARATPLGAAVEAGVRELPGIKAGIKAYEAVKGSRIAPPALPIHPKASGPFVGGFPLPVTTEAPGAAIANTGEVLGGTPSALSTSPKAPFTPKAPIPVQEAPAVGLPRKAPFEARGPIHVEEATPIDLPRKTSFAPQEPIPVSTAPSGPVEANSGQPVGASFADLVRAKASELRKTATAAPVAEAEASAAATSPSLIHRSPTTGMTELDPERFGSGPLTSSESKRAGDPNFLKRSFSQVEGVGTPDQLLQKLPGDYVVEGVTNADLYDMQNDPRGFRAGAEKALGPVGSLDRAAVINLAEKNAVEAGLTNHHYPDAGVVQHFKPVKVRARGAAPTSVVTNASGESEASAEAINRAAGAKARGDVRVVQGPGGERVLGDATTSHDYSPAKRETVGIRHKDGTFTVEKTGEGARPDLRAKAPIGAGNKAPSAEVIAGGVKDAADLPAARRAIRAEVKRVYSRRLPAPMQLEMMKNAEAALLKLKPEWAQ